MFLKNNKETKMKRGKKRKSKPEVKIIDLRKKNTERKEIKSWKTHLKW